MKFEVKKETLINLTQDSKILPAELTKEIAGGGNTQPPGWVSYNAPTGLGTQTGTNESCNHVLLP